MSRRLLTASNTVSRSGSTGRSRGRKLEERREGMEASRLVKMVVVKLREGGGTGW